MSQGQTDTPEIVRNQHGRIVRTPEQIARDHEAAQLRSHSFTFQQIGDRFGVNASGAYKMVQRAIADIPRGNTIELVALELEKLDAIERKYLEIAAKHHVFVSQGGKVVYDGDVKLEDDGPAMQAMSRLLKVAERRAKLLGLDAPVKAQVEVVNYDADSIEYRVLELRRALESTGGEPIPLDGRTSETRAVTA